MAKSESTAVNDLISLVQGGGKPLDEPAEDLFGPPKARLTTSTVPSMRAAGPVAPLPPQRAPIGTAQLNVNDGKPVRMVTAPPSRVTTIPPLPQPRAASPSKLPPPRPSASPPPRSSTEMPTADIARASTQLPTAPVAPVAAKPATTLPPPATLRTPSPRAPSPSLVDIKPALPAWPPPPTDPVRATGIQRTVVPPTAPVAAPFDDRAPIDKTGDVVSADSWFEASRMVEKIDETYVGTARAPKRRDPSAAIKKVLLPLVVLSIVSAGVAYVVFSHHPTKVAPPVTHVAAPAAKLVPAAPVAVPSSTTPSTESANAATATAGGTQPEPPLPSAAPAQDDAVSAHPNANDVKIISKASGDSAPAPAPVEVAAASAAPAAPTAPVAADKVVALAETAPVVHEVPTAHGIVKLVDVRIDSKPAGATVMLVDNGKTSFLGTTPVAASVDPSRSYDVVLTMDGRPTQIAHLDPSKAQRLEITLTKGGAAAKTETRIQTKADPKIETPAASKAAAAPKAAPAKKHVAASAPAGGLVDPGFDAPKAEVPHAEAPKAAEGGAGTLMVSSKPPCEIWIDGNDTGLMTPQKSISLPAGSHKVTFVNTSENITKTVPVKITADQPTKLIQNLMAN